MKKTTKKIRKTNKTKDKIVIESNSKKAISIIIFFGVAVLFFLSNIDMCGGFGNFIKNITLSLFGTFGYFFPLLFILAILFTIINDRSIGTLKRYSLYLSYFSLLSLFHFTLNDRPAPNDSFITTMNKYIELGKTVFTFERNQFSGGIIGTFIAEGLAKFISSGTFVVLLISFIISLVLFTGISFYGKLFLVVLEVLTFIPKLIANKIEEKKANDEIAKQNEEYFNETLNNKIKKINNKNMIFGTNEEIPMDTLSDNYSSNLSERVLINPLPNEKKSLDTSNIDLDPSLIQKRFLHIKNEEKPIEKEEKQVKDELLKSLKKESLNEIVYNNKNIKVDDFFYTNESNKKENYDIQRIVLDNDKDDVNNYNEENDNIQEYQNTNDNYVKNEIEDIVVNETNEQYIDNISDFIEEKSKENRPHIPSYVDKKEDATQQNKSVRRKKSYKFPPLEYLKKNNERTIFDKDLTKSVSEKLTTTLAQFGVGVVVTDVSVGPTVTRYELLPNLGVKVSKVLSLQDDIKLALAASEIRIEAPIPGKSAIGIEVPNKKNVSVLLGDLISNKEFKEQKSLLSVCIGKDIAGKNVYCDIDKMPHLLIAGATGSGKSVCINSIIMSLIYKASPKECRMILIDPKVVELQIYNEIPHLFCPVVTDPKKASLALDWAVKEMQKRYKIFADKQVKDLAGYNQLIEIENKNAIYEDSHEEKMPRIVIIIDELSDLMMTCGKNVENSIVRLAQLSRACGIHLVIATQRPSVNVVTGLIKANVPSRIAFSVTSGVDSRTILDMNGAEDLLGHGDMLYFPTGYPKPLRVQGCFVGEDEIKKVVDFVKDMDTTFDETVVSSMTIKNNDTSDGYDEKDELFYEAGILCIETKQPPSIGMLQRRFRMGFNRAARVIDQLEQEGVLTPQDGKKPREVLMSKEEFEQKFG